MGSGSPTHGVWLPPLCPPAPPPQGGSCWLPVNGERCRAKRAVVAPSSWGVPCRGRGQPDPPGRVGTALPPNGPPITTTCVPLCYSDSDAVLLCFDVSRPETLDSASKKTEILDYCPNTRLLLIGCKTDLRTDLSMCWSCPTKSRPRQLGAESYLECSAFTSEKSVHSIFRPPVPPGVSPSALLHLPTRSELISSAFKKEKAKSCSVM
uniref:Rho family GTPase 1 n=1 Tax=Gallus gallus TaxID=9031 RepID=A0A8V0ZRK3_CHICK